MRASWVVSLCEKETRGEVPLLYHFYSSRVFPLFGRWISVAAEV